MRTIKKWLHEIWVIHGGEYKDWATLVRDPTYVVSSARSVPSYL